MSEAGNPPCFQVAEDARWTIGVFDFEGPLSETGTPSCFQAAGDSSWIVGVWCFEDLRV